MNFYSRRKNRFFANIMASFLLLFVSTNSDASEENLIAILQKVESRDISSVDALGKITDIYLSGVERAANFDSIVAEYISYGRIRRTEDKMLPTPNKDGYLLRTKKPMNAEEMHQFLKLFSAAAVSGSMLSLNIGLNLHDQKRHPSNVEYHMKACSVLSKTADYLNSDPNSDFNDYVSRANVYFMSSNFNTLSFIGSLNKLDNNFADKFKFHIKDAAQKLKASSILFSEKTDFFSYKANLQQVPEFKQPLLEDIKSYISKNRALIYEDEFTEALDDLKSAFAKEDDVIEAINKVHKLVLQHKIQKSSYVYEIIEKLWSYYLSAGQHIMQIRPIKIFEGAYKTLNGFIPSDSVRDFLIEVAKKSYNNKGYARDELIRLGNVMAGFKAATTRLNFEIMQKTLPKLINSAAVDSKQVEQILTALKDYAATDAVEEAKSSKHLSKISDLSSILHSCFSRLENVSYEYSTLYEERFKTGNQKANLNIKKIIEYLNTINSSINKIQAFDSDNELRPISDLSEEDHKHLIAAQEAALKIFLIPFYSNYNSEKKKIEAKIGDILSGSTLERTKLKNLVLLLKNYELYGISKDIFSNIDGFINSYKQENGVNDYFIGLLDIDKVVGSLGSSKTEEENTENREMFKEFLTKLLDDKEKTATSIYNLVMDTLEKFGVSTELPKISMADLGLGENLPEDTKGLFDIVQKGFDKSRYTNTKDDKYPFRGNEYVESYKFSSLTENIIIDLGLNKVKRDLVFIMFLLGYNQEKMEEVLSNIITYKRADYRKRFEFPLRKLMNKYSHDRNPENSLVSQQINLSIDYLKKLLKIEN